MKICYSLKKKRSCLCVFPPLGSLFELSVHSEKGLHGCPSSYSRGGTLRRAQTETPGRGDFLFSSGVGNVFWPLLPGEPRGETPRSAILLEKKCRQGAWPACITSKKCCELLNAGLCVHVCSCDSGVLAKHLHFSSCFTSSNQKKSWDKGCKGVIEMLNIFSAVFLRERLEEIWIFVPLEGSFWVKRAAICHKM